MSPRADDPVGAAGDDVSVQAKEAWAVAPQLCAPTGCAWYHGVWPTLRSLGLVATPYRHLDFFDRELGAAAEARRRRVLVTGAADAAMAEVVLGAYASRGSMPALTVLDRCATPVHVVGEWALRAGTTVDGLVGDVLDPTLEVDEHDVVCTHGLFALVEVDRRAELAVRWARCLRPGGVLVTTSSVAAADTPDPDGFSAEAVERFEERVRDSGAAPEVVAAARRWAEGAHVHPVRDPGDVEAVLRSAGLEPRISLRQVDGMLGRHEGGPTGARSAVYLEIVATRR